jgi:hypothetical protein
MLNLVQIAKNYAHLSQNNSQKAIVVSYFIKELGLMD